MTFGDYVRILRTYWKSMLLVTLLAVGAAGGISAAMTPTYTATAGVLFTPVAADANGQSLAFAAQYTQSRMVVYQGLVDTPQVLGAVVSKLDLDVTPTQLADQVSASFDASSTLLTISVEDESAAEATDIASGVAQSLVAAVVTFETQVNPNADEEGQPATASRVSGRLVSDPARPTSPSSPDWKLNLVAGLLLGLVLAAAQAGIRHVRTTFAPPRPAEAEGPAVLPPPLDDPPPAPPVATTATPPTPPTPKAKRSGKRTRR